MELTAAALQARINELRERLARPLPLQTNAFGYRLQDHQELRNLESRLNASTKKEQE